MKMMAFKTRAGRPCHCSGRSPAAVVVFLALSWWWWQGSAFVAFMLSVLPAALAVYAGALLLTIPEPQFSRCLALCAGSGGIVLIAWAPFLIRRGRPVLRQRNVGAISAGRGR